MVEEAARHLAAEGRSRFVMSSQALELFANELESGMHRASRRTAAGAAPSLSADPSYPSLADAIPFVMERLEGMMDLWARFSHVGDQASVRRALGRPHDPKATRQVAEAITELYESQLDWKSSFRAAAGPAEVTAVFEKFAFIAVRPIEQIERYERESVASIRECLDAVRSGRRRPEELTLTLKLELRLDETAVEEAVSAFTRGLGCLGDPAASREEFDSMGVLRALTKELDPATRRLETRRPVGELD